MEEYWSSTQIVNFISLILQHFSTSDCHCQGSNIKNMKAFLNILYTIITDGKVNSSTSGKYIMSYNIILRVMKLCELFEMLYSKTGTRTNEQLFYLFLQTGKFHCK